MPALFQLWTGFRSRVTSLALRMDWPRGLRAGIGLCVPLVASDIFGYAGLGWTALGGFEAIIADSGGPYRDRLGKLGVITLGGGLACTIGTLAGNNLHWAVPVTALFCALWSYLGVLGQPFTSASVLVQVIYFCGLGAPDPSWRAALVRGLLVLAGGLWAITFSLVLWPFDPYRPARRTVSDCYLALASFLTSITELANRKQVRPALWHRLAGHHQRRIRQQIETAWQAVASVRAESLAETAQGSYMVVLLETADMVLARTVSLAEHLEAVSSELAELPGADNRSACSIRSHAALQELRSSEEWIAALLRRRASTLTVEAQAEIHTRRAALAELPKTLRNCLAEEDTDGRFLLLQATEAIALMDTAAESAAALQLGESETLPLGATSPHVRERIQKLRQTLPFAKLRANLTTDSLLLRHSLRAAVVSAMDIVLVRLLHVEHGYWLMMTSLIVLQPHVGGTLRKGIERVIGTVGGGILAALLAVTLGTPMAIAIALFPLAVLCLALLPVSYAAFAFFLTPTFVLAYLPRAGDWQLAAVRVGDTILGAAVSLAAMSLLFPSFERDRLGKYLLASLDANLRYLDLLAQSWSTQDPATRALAQARRQTGLAHNATEESLERVRIETWRRRAASTEAALSLSTYLRRFAQSITTLTTLEGDESWKQSPLVTSRLSSLRASLLELHTEVLHPSESAHPYTNPLSSGDTMQEPYAVGIEDSAEDLSTAFAEDLAAQAIPGASALGERQLFRMERQVGVLHRQILTLRQRRWLRHI